MALQEASEAFLVRIFQTCVLIVANAKRVTVMLKDIHSNQDGFGKTVDFFVDAFRTRLSSAYYRTTQRTTTTRV